MTKNVGALLRTSAIGHAKSVRLQITVQSKRRTIMIQHEDTSARWFIYTSVTFFLITILVGVIMTVKLIAPEFLGGLGPLSFGRTRPIHTNGVIFGWLLAADMGLCYYIVPRLAGVKL